MRRFRFVVLALLAISLPSLSWAQDSDGDGIPDSTESSLAERFAPVLRLAPKEAYPPVAIQYALNNSELRFQEGGASTTIQASPTVESISVFRDPDSGYFLDNTRGSIDDQGIRDSFASVKKSLEPTVYARVTGDSSYTVVQYWFYYPFNDGPLNSHEGDWEMVQILLQGEEPVSAAYSQHFSGQKVAWSKVLLRKGHLVVYVARGSHANYFRAYQGVLGVQNDEVSALGAALEPDSYQLVVLGELDLHPADQDWLVFSGRWGEWGEAEDQLMGRRGPPGPGQGDNAEKWESPSSWQEELPSLDTSWLWLSWIVSNFAILFGLYILVRGLWKIIGLGRSVLSRQALKGLGVGSGLAIAGALLAVLAIWQPWYSINLNVPAGEYRTDGDATVMLVDGARGVQLNDPQSNRGLVTLMGLKMPIGVIFISGLVFLFLDVVKAKAPSELRGGFIRGGVANVLVPLVPMLVLIAMMGPVVKELASVALKEEVPETVAAMMDQVSGNPVLGSYQGDLPEIGDAKLSWGLGPGCIMIIAAGVLKIIGGLASGKGAAAEATEKAGSAPPTQAEGEPPESQGGNEPERKA